MTATASLKVDNVDKFLWDRAPDPEDSDSEFCLDLAHINLIERPAGLVLSTALVGILGQRPVVVKADPKKPGTISQNGIAFALAHRRGRVTYLGIDEDTLGLRDWRCTWTPGARSTHEPALFQQTLFPEDEEDPSLFGPMHAAFVNAHLSGPRGAQTEVAKAVPRWLRRLLPHGVRDSHSVSRIVRVLDELLDNIREHALMVRPDGNPTRSLVQIARTRGTTDRLYVSVIDNGPGIAATLRPKLGGIRSVDDEALIRRLLKGELDRWEPGRGIGFAAVRRAMDEEEGLASLLVATDRHRFEVNARDVVSLSPGYPIQGTVLVAVFRLPAVRSSSSTT